MEYDPLKDRAASLIRIFPMARTCFYRCLDLLLLRQRYVKRCLARYASGNEKLRFYDAGAGFCQYSWHILSRWPDSRVFASDLKGDYLADFADFARSRFPGRFSCQTADLQDFTPQNSYDLITAIDILEHIENDIAVLRNFHNCLAEKGILIISTPSDTDEAAQFTEEHVRPGYNKAELEQKLEGCGFEILESLYSYGTWGGLAWRLLIKHPLTWLQKSRLSLFFLPIYYILLFPIAELLMRLDLKADNKTGTGLIIVARKKS
ncbi:MAG: methyltransferase domain-containing protein [Candidatus Syntrophosphaera sp.]|nr:methyltransferase domain-containing protein [Candidatus Syntrophosphaera sp.]